MAQILNFVSSPLGDNQENRFKDFVISPLGDNQENRINDFDLEFPIDKSLEDFEYIYRCGNHKNEVERYYFLPDDYIIFYPKVLVFNNSTRELFDLTKNIFQLKMNEFEEQNLEELIGKKRIVEYYQIQKKN